MYAYGGIGKNIAHTNATKALQGMKTKEHLFVNSVNV